MDSDINKVIDIFINHPYSSTQITSPNASVKDLQQVLFPIRSPRKFSSSESFLCNTFLKPTKESTDDSDEVPSNHTLKSKDSKELFSKDFTSSGQPPRWPTECQVLEERIKHIPTNACPPEPYYTPTGKEVQPKPIGEESGIIVYQYYPISAVNYFCRSSVGGSKYLLPTCPSPEEDGLRFESRFESGNLAKAIKITANYYELYLRTDLYTDRHMQWFYFRLNNMKKSVMYRFSIVNFTKEHSLYAEGMRPLLYSEKDAQLHSIGWRRCGDNVTYFSNDNLTPEESDQPLFYTLTFTLEFPHDDDTVYLAHSYPYTYSDLQEYLLELTAHPIKQTFTTLRLLCKTLAGNNVYYVTVTSPPDPAEAQNNTKKKRAIVVTARVHPGETPASWMMRGFLEFLTSDSGPAKELRDKFIFKLVPMLNPDGVIVGNNRCSLTGRDLNRQYRTVIRETYPSIWYTKLMIRRLLEECGVAMYCDLHAHSKKHNIFIFGCENRRGPDRTLQEQVFPLMLHKNAADKFSFENCNFRIRRCKEGTGRVVMWMMGIGNSYTMEASFGGSNLGARGDTHYNTQDYELMGRSFCQTLLDYYDEDPRKERLRLKIITRLAKEGSSADEPMNIRLSDYSSDEGETTSSSSDLEGDAPLKDYKLPFVPPPSPALIKKKPKKVVKEIDRERPKTASKSVSQRKPLQVRKTNLGLTLTQKSSFSETSSSDSDSYRPLELTKVKPQRKKKKKRRNKKVEYSDTEIQLRRVSDRKLAVLELLPESRLFSQSWSNKMAGAMPQPKPIMDIRRTTTQQLAEVQARLMTLRNKLWYGVGDSDKNIPLSWSCSSLFENDEKQKLLKKKVSEKKKSSKKLRHKDEFVKDAKEVKDIRNSSKKLPVTFRRQTAVEVPSMKSNNNKGSPKFRKTKSLSDTEAKKSKTQNALQLMKAMNASINFQPKNIPEKFTSDLKNVKKKKKKIVKVEKVSKLKTTD